MRCEHRLTFTSSFAALLYWATGFTRKSSTCFGSELVNVQGYTGQGVAGTLATYAANPVENRQLQVGKILPILITVPGTRYIFESLIDLFVNRGNIQTTFVSRKR